MVTMKEAKERLFCDLHTHSFYSDGTFTPAEIVEQAEKQGLFAVALTDHNTVAGLPEFMEVAKDKQVNAVAGIEISTDYGEIELHVLALFLQPSAYKRVEELLEEMTRRRIESNRQMLTRLNASGFDVSYEEIKKRTQAKAFNRAHVGAVMTEKGYTTSIADAFDRYLAVGKGYYIGPKRLSVFEVISFIKEIGAKAVLAHPLLQLTEAELRELLPKAIACGLDGMETMYSGYSAEMIEKSRALAKEFGLKESGGSDFHGENRPGVLLGVGRGSLAIPKAFFEDLAGACTR